MNIQRVKDLYEENRLMVDATVKVDEAAFTAFLVEKHPQVAEELKRAQDAGKQPKTLILKVYKIYMVWKATQK